MSIKFGILICSPHISSYILWKLRRKISRPLFCCENRILKFITVMFNFSENKGRRLWTGMKWVLYAEIAFFGGAYYVWHRMNTQQDFRKYMHDSHPKILELFYKGAEFGGFKDARQQDYATWGISQSASDQDL